MIDAHQHLWQIDRPECTWPTPELTAIYRDFGLDDWEPLAAAMGVTGSVLVQSQESDADTDFLLQLAEQSALIKAVVGWVDLASPRAPARIKQLAAHPKLRAIRPMLQGLGEDDWLLKPALVPAIEAMQASGLCLDALVFPRHLPVLETFARRYPLLPMVIDHAAKPTIAAADSLQFAQWQAALQRLAEFPQVCVKLSGLVTEAGADQTPADLASYSQWLLSCFGPERVLWGSDWPVLKLAPNSQWRSYESWLHLSRQLLQALTPEQQAWVFAQAAQKFYGID